MPSSPLANLKFLIWHHSKSVIDQARLGSCMQVWRDIRAQEQIKDNVGQEPNSYSFGGLFMSSKQPPNKQIKQPLNKHNTLLQKPMDTQTHSTTHYCNSPATTGSGVPQTSK